MHSEQPIPVLHQLDQKIIYPHYDFKHLTEKYFEIGMKLNDFSIQLVKYCIHKYETSKGTGKLNQDSFHHGKHGKHRNLCARNSFLPCFPCFPWFTFSFLND